MTVTLTPDQEAFIAQQLASGHYQSPGDAINESLGMLRSQEEFIRANATELRRNLAVGLEQARRGELVDGKTAIEDLRRTLRQRGSGLCNEFLRVLPQANLDVKEIAVYIYDRNPAAADRFLSELDLAHAENLSQAPRQRGRLRRKLGEGVRSTFPIGSYLIFYHLHTAGSPSDAEFILRWPGGFPGCSGESERH